MPAPTLSTVPTARVVLVTGAAKRLGREIALALARAGWQVAVHFRDSLEDARRTSAECAQLSGNSAVFRANLGNETAVRNLLPRVVAHFGRVDALVNSASTFEYDAVQNFSFTAMDKHLRANTGAAILLAQALHTHILARQPAPPPDGSAPTGPAVRGAVVNLLDQKLWNQNPDFLSYTLSKAALEAANTMLALALAPQLRVVGVAPGLTLTTPLLTDAQFAERHRTLSLLDQSSTPQDVADTVRFVLENGSITGTTLLVDSGQHLMHFKRDFSLLQDGEHA